MDLQQELNFLRNKISDENLNFLKKFQEKDVKTNYHINKTWGIEGKEDVVLKVYSLKQPCIPKIMKTLSLNIDDYIGVNLVLNGLRAVFDMMGKQGKYKCYNFNRFLCFTDFFWTKKTIGGKTNIVFVYVYNMVQGLDLFDWTSDLYNKMRIAEMPKSVNFQDKYRKGPALGEFIVDKIVGPVVGGIKYGLNIALSLYPKPKNTLDEAPFQHHKYADVVEEKANKIDFELLVFITYAAFTNLSILHYNGINHRDIKLDNIIFNPKLSIKHCLKFIDFDFSCSTPTCFSTPGTRGYYPSTLLEYQETQDESLIDEGIWPYCDIVSLAITIYKLYVLDLYNDVDIMNASRFNPVDDIAEEQLIASIKYRKRTKVYNENEEEFMRLIMSFLDMDRTRLYTSHEICEMLYDKYSEFIPRELVEAYEEDLNLYSIQNVNKYISDHHIDIDQEIEDEWDECERVNLTKYEYGGEEYDIDAEMEL